MSSGFVIQPASRKKAKIKIGIAGPSGSGKTYSALLLANGIVPWEKICVIDTERDSASLYSHLGNFSTLSLDAPFTPERYIEAMEAVVNAGFEVCIVDSITHEWDGVGGILEVHEKMQGNSFTNWAKLTPRHTKFVNAIIESPIFVIACGRTKQDYVLSEKNGKMVPEKVGLKTITREGFDYEVTLSFELDIKHWANASKDRTGLFMDKPQFVISQETGEIIKKWCESGEVNPYYEEILSKINTAQDLNELKSYAGIIKQFNFSNYELVSLRQAYSVQKKNIAAIPKVEQQPLVQPVPIVDNNFYGGPGDEPSFENEPEFIPEELPPDQDLPFPETNPKSPLVILDNYIENLENSMSVDIIDAKYSGMKFLKDYALLDSEMKALIEKRYQEIRTKLLLSEPSGEENVIISTINSFKECKTVTELKKAREIFMKTAAYALSSDADRQLLTKEFSSIKKGLEKNGKVQK